MIMKDQVTSNQRINFDRNVESEASKFINDLKHGCELYSQSMIDLLLNMDSYRLRGRLVKAGLIPELAN